jgi:hypothetical protein
MTAQKDYSNFGKTETGGQFNMRAKTTTEHLTSFINSLKIIEENDYYGEMYLPQIGQIKDENEQFLEYMIDLFSDEYLNGNDAIIQRSLNVIEYELNSVDENNIEIISNIEYKSEYKDEIIKNRKQSLQSLHHYLSGLLPVNKTPEPNTNNNTSETVEPIDLQISSKDAHRLIVLWELDIIDFLQKEGYSNNLIGEITALLFQQKNGKSIGSLIGKMGSDDPGSPIYGDKNMALRMTLSALKTKYRKTR